MDALEGVCEQMYSYEIQEEDKAAFRYARRRSGRASSTINISITMSSRLGGTKRFS